MNIRILHPLREESEMSDIIVTIPKSRLKQVQEEEREVAEGIARGEEWKYWWSMGSQPTKLKEGDRCYFVWHGAIRAWHKVIEIEPGQDNRHCRLWLDSTIHDIVPVLMNGFQGFRYVKPGQVFKETSE